MIHLGSGASICAVRDGRVLDTSMGLTPLGGLVMGTRPGDLDPGLLTWLMRTEGLTPEQLEEFLNRSCGLLGISGGTSDMRELLARRPTDIAAAEAVDFFCYQAKKYLGAYVAILGGLDTLVFSGGIGEHSPEIRAGICKGFEFLGLHLDEQRNRSSAALISRDTSAVRVRVIPTDEEAVMAQIAAKLLNADNTSNAIKELTR